MRENKGAAGVDRITLVAVEEYGVDRMLRELRCDLRDGSVSSRAGQACGDPETTRW